MRCELHLTFLLHLIKQDFSILNSVDFIIDFFGPNTTELYYRACELSYYQL